MKRRRLAATCLILLSLSAAALADMRVIGVRFHGNHSIPDDELQRMVGLSSGDTVSESELERLRSRLLASGRFEFPAALEDREITRIAKNAAGQIVAVSRPAPLGCLPPDLAARLKPMKCQAVKLDGQAWSEAAAAELPPEAGPPAWQFKHIKKLVNRDKSQGNFLFPAAGKEPALYVKEVFYPQVLCADQGSMWLSTYTGLLRIPFGGSAPEPAK